MSTLRALPALGLRSENGDIGDEGPWKQSSRFHWRVAAFNWTQCSDPRWPTFASHITCFEHWQTRADIDMSRIPGYTERHLAIQLLQGSPGEPQKHDAEGILVTHKNYSNKPRYPFTCARKNRQRPKQVSYGIIFLRKHIIHHSKRKSLILGALDWKMTRDLAFRKTFQLPARYWLPMLSARDPCFDSDPPLCQEHPRANAKLMQS